MGIWHLAWVQIMGDIGVPGNKAAEISHAGKFAYACCTLLV
jgi:hypothetical protein